MFSKTSMKALKHKAKKGMMKRIGKVESRPEDPKFKDILAAMEKFKLEIKDFQFHANGAAQAGKSYNSSIEHFCGPGIKGEGLFNKEDLFVSAVQERFGPALDNLVITEIPKYDELVVAYKTAKLNFDSIYFQTVKEMRKKEINGSDNHEEVMKNNISLAGLQQSYFDSKKDILNQQDIFKGRLENEVSSALSEVHEASDAEHHQLYVDFMKKRIARTAAICGGTAVIGHIETSQKKLEQKAEEVDVDIEKGDQKVNNVDAAGEEDAAGQEEAIEENNKNNSEINPVESPAVEEEKGVLDGMNGFSAENEMPDLENDEEDIPNPPSRKAPDVPSDEVSSPPVPPQGVPQPPAPPAPPAR
jgi:hypothetical protein